MATPVEGDGLATQADTGRAPVKVGGVVANTPAVQVDGTRGNFFQDLRGSLKVCLMGQNGTTSPGLSGPGDGIAALTGIAVIGQEHLMNGATWDRKRSSSATNLALQSGLGSQLSSLPGQWGIVHLPATNTQATVSKAAVASTRHVATAVTATLASGSTAITVPATPVNVVIRDGASGAGTILWQSYISAITTAGSFATISLAGLNLVGTANTAMTVEFSAAGGVGTFESVSLQGYSVT